MLVLLLSEAVISRILLQRLCQYYVELSQQTSCVIHEPLGDFRNEAFGWMLGTQNEIRT